MKKALIFLVILIPIMLFAQSSPFNVKAKTSYSSSGMYGKVKVDSVSYTQLRLIQEFDFWKISMGLDLEFLLDKDYHLRPNNWDHLKDYLNKFYYVKYGKKGDPVYAHLGGFPGLTLGNGLIMQNYNNMLLYPDQRNTGLMIGANPDIVTSPSFELFTSDLTQNEILSFSTRFKPLPDSTIRILDDITLGFSLVADRDQYGNIDYFVPDSLSYLTKNLKSKPAMIYGVGYLLPFFKNDLVTVSNYAEIAHIHDYGTGSILPGIYADFSEVKINLEYRIYGNKFIPAFFNKYYEEDRAYLQGDSIMTLVTREEGLKYIKASQGWSGSIQAQLYEKIKGMFAWQNTFGKDLTTGKSIWIKLWVDSKYKRLENFFLGYSKVGTQSMAIHRINEHNANIEGGVTLKVTKKRLFATAGYEERYKDLNNNGKVNWATETKRNWSVGVVYKF
jgi:hypothetical protein